MSKRVCMIRQNYFPEEAHLRKNVDALTEAGFRVDVICLREQGAAAREDYRGGTVYRLPLTHRRSTKVRYLFEYMAFFVMASLLLAYRTLRQRYHLIEVYNMPDFLVFAALPAKLAGTKIILYLFELTPEHAGNLFSLNDSHFVIRLLHWLERKSVSAADHVIVVSEFQKEIIAGRTTPRARPSVILNVPDETLFASCGEPQAATSGEPFRILTHGSILERYGIQTLVRAVPHIRADIPNLRVDILGEGEYRLELQQLVADLGVSDEVRFIDYVPIERVPGVISRADLGIVPLPLAWLLPNKLFEYVAMDRAVVASASPSVAPLFDKDAIAFFWPNDERDLARRVVELYRDPEMARRMARNARRQFANCGWATMRHRYIDLHQDLLSDTRMDRPETNRSAT